MSEAHTQITAWPPGTRRQYCARFARETAGMFARGWRWLVLTASLYAAAFAIIDATDGRAPRWLLVASFVVALVVVLAGFYASLHLMSRASGYRPATPAELVRLHDKELVHFSRATAAELVDADGNVALDPGRCRWSGRMFRADGWRLRYEPAVFFFSEVSRERYLYHLGPRALPTVVYVRFADLQAQPVFIRPCDGAIALAKGHAGRAVVQSVA